MSQHREAFERDKVVKIISSVIDQVGSKDGSLSREKLAADILDLAKVIDDARREIAQMRPASEDGEEATAKDELDAVVEETAKATGTIMDSCDVIQTALGSIKDSEAKAQIESAVMNIFEACSFQDITGQRITKVVKTIHILDEKVDSLVTLIGPSAKYGTSGVGDDGKDPLLNGPQMADKAMSQEDIDALLDSFD